MSSLPRLIDVDCNLWHKDLVSFHNRENAEEGSFFDILKEDAIRESNVVAMLSPSSTVKEAQAGLQALSSVDKTPMIPIKTTVGVHPYHVDEEGSPTKEKVEELKALIKDNTVHVAAVGECGLDTSEGFPPLENQLPWFRAQVELASQLGLPLFVHERLAFEETMKILDQTSVPVIIHCFTGTRDQCRDYVSRGYYLSVSGIICKENAGSAEVRTCLEEGLIPMDKLMVETDAPYMGFEGCRLEYIEKHADFVANLNAKKRKRLSKSIYPNLPSALPQVIDKVVECLNKGRQSRQEEPLERNQVAEQMTQNAIDFFAFENLEGE